MNCKRNKIISLFLCFLIFTTIFHYHGKHTQTREGLIVEVPIEAFDKNGKLIDNKWKTYLQKNKPIGVIFFKSHFPNKEVGKKIISEVKNTINDNVILSADEEGGRVNRFDWLDINSAKEIAEEYAKIKNKDGYNQARKFVRKQYIPMFKEMKEMGLNMTFAPNLDLNKYENLKEGTNEYKNYKQCAKYVRLARKTADKIKKIEQNDYQNALYFLAYLDEIGKRKINLKFLNNKEQIKQAIQKWSKINQKEKQKLIKQFNPLAQYANYASVVGDRSFGLDTKIVSEVAEIFIDTANEFGITCVAKHILGHGRVDGDTHLEKQHLTAPIEDIIRDIQPYIYLKDKINFIMPSHIIYNAVDNEKSAVNSKKVLDFVRQYVKKDVLFITDDISMEGANDNVKSPCELWIVSHKTIDEVKQFGKQNRLNKNKYKHIFDRLC